MESMKHCLKRYGGSAEFITFWDVDEFLVSVTKSLKQINAAGRSGGEFHRRSGNEDMDPCAIGFRRGG
jgi:hypothetical protein